MAVWQEAIKQAQASTVEVVGAEPTPLRRLEIYCDGAVLDNPGGPGGWGFVARRAGEIIYRAHGPLFGKSNNQAEYQAAIKALMWIEAEGLTYEPVTIYSDSQLVVNQIIGEWACQAPHLQALMRQCRWRASKIGSIEWAWIPREANQEADAEASKAVAELLNIGEEEMAIVSDAWQRKFAILKAEKKAKQVIARTVTNVSNYAKKSKRKIIHTGLPPTRTKKGGR